MGMSQLVEKNLSPPRMTGAMHGTLNCSQVAGEGPVGSEAACCWMSAMKAVPWSMSIHPWEFCISIETGVDAGSTLVPEVMWASSASMRVVGGFIMFIGAAEVFCGIGICISMPGVSGVDVCMVCALVMS